MNVRARIQGKVGTGLCSSGGWLFVRVGVSLHRPDVLVKAVSAAKGLHTYIHISFRENQEHVKRMARHIWQTKTPLNIVRDLLFSKKSHF
jgi:hypothetical protein